MWYVGWSYNFFLKNDNILLLFEFPLENKKECRTASENSGLIRAEVTSSLMVVVVVVLGVLSVIICFCYYKRKRAKDSDRPL